MIFGLLSIAVLFLVSVGLQEWGRLLGKARLRAGKRVEGVAAMEGAAFALLTLLIAFTFNGAATRFDARRQLLVQESNALGTAWLRLDLLPADAQPAAREHFRAYLDQRIAAYAAGPLSSGARAHLDSAAVHQAQLWSVAVAGAMAVPSPAVATLVIPPLNESFDLASTRLAATMMHPPAAVWVLLTVLLMVCCLLSGFDMAVSEQRSWLHVVTMSLLLTVTIYVTVDYEFPRLGIIRVDNFDQLLVSLRAQIR